MTPVAPYPHTRVRDTIVPTIDSDIRKDRPAWIPDDVGDDWDPNPYAYQTEEERMPAGLTHSDYIKVIVLMLELYLTRIGLQSWLDVFILYRKASGLQDRVAPDCTIAHSIPPHMVGEVRGAYDLDKLPVPLCLIEVVSPDSYEKDFNKQRALYESWGVLDYLVLKGVNKKGLPLMQVELTLWHLVHGRYVKVAVDADGFLPMQSIGVGIRADGKQIIMRVLATGERLLTPAEQSIARELAEERLRREQELAEERLRREQEQHRAQQQAMARAMLADGIAPASIAKYTGLALDEIDALV